MGDDERVPEAYALEDFYFDGITNLFIAGSSFHVTFWTWQQTEAGLFKFGIRRGVCPVENVPDCIAQATSALGKSMLRNPHTIRQFAS